jgi:hypothetical protein
MKTQVNDTDPRIEEMLIEAYRRMTPAEKLASVQAGNRAVQALQLADIRRRHPDAGERELQLRLASRCIDRDLMVKAFGWDPDVEGY